MIKLIASDMDGTLLDSNKNLSPSIYSILRKLNDKGIVFVAISGRNIISLKELFKDIKEVGSNSEIVGESTSPSVYIKKLAVSGI